MSDGQRSAQVSGRRGCLNGDGALSDLLDDVQRMVTGVGQIRDLAIELAGASHEPDAVRQEWLRREASKGLRRAYDNAMATRTPHASVPVEALGAALELLEPRRGRS